MALPIVTLYNFKQTINELKHEIDMRKLYIYTVLSNRDVEGKPGPKKRLYIAVDRDVNILEYTLQFARFCLITDNYKTRILQPDGTHEIKKLKTKHFGWHQVWSIPQNQKKPLFDKLILKPTPYCEYNGKFLYEVTWEGYDCLYDFLIEKQPTGYIAHKYKIVFNPEYSESDAAAASENDEEYNIPEKIKCTKRFVVTYLDMVCSSKCGLALVRNEKIVSNYATFKGIRNEHAINKEGLLNEGYTHDEIVQMYAEYFPDDTRTQIIENKINGNEFIKLRIFSFTR